MHVYHTALDGWDTRFSPGNEHTSLPLTPATLVTLMARVSIWNRLDPTLTLSNPNSSNFLHPLPPGTPSPPPSAINYQIFDLLSFGHQREAPRLPQQMGEHRTQCTGSAEITTRRTPGNRWCQGVWAANRWHPFLCVARGPAGPHPGGLHSRRLRKSTPRSVTRPRWSTVSVCCAVCASACGALLTFVCRISLRCAYSASPPPPSQSCILDSPPPRQVDACGSADACLS